jgi:hypothetical protein
MAGLLADRETLQTLRELGMPFSDYVVRAVARSGRLSILQYLITEQRCPIPGLLSYYAARSGSITMLEWLKAERLCAFGHDMCAGAAEGGQLAALQHLRSEGCGWNEVHIACYAVKGGSIEVVEWLRQEQGIEVPTDVLFWAAGNGKISMCAHLRSIGCAWDVYACTQAAANGHYDTLRWLHEQGCPWDEREVFVDVARNGCTNILAYFTEQGAAIDAQLLTEALNGAGASGRLQTAQWLRQHNAQWPAVLSFEYFDEIEQWSGESLAWARAEGCTSPIAH